jgi:KUP system potassium uptake protein
MTKLISSEKRTLGLSLAALGVVYGDIGTSPLYALRESLSGLPITADNIFGVLSLIFWTLILVVSIKYVTFILRADNDGEGGVLALLALLRRTDGRFYKILFFIGVFGAGLLFGDAMLTPAISVSSAVEGLLVIAPSISHYVLPITILILIFLFLNQYHGTAKIGRYFGPIILFWFLVLAVLGLFRIIDNPEIFKAINPYYAVKFFETNGWTGYALLGGVFLVVTGGEAMYADLGHFGKIPIRLGWFFVALPALLLNYFGQGAYLLKDPAAIVNPFYALAPGWFSYPLLILATMATIIASQAVISATFSLAKQAVLLDLYPRIPIIQTSAKERGQIYVPQMNIILGIGTILLIITFKNSSALTHAYGIAVNLVMLTVTMMVCYVAHANWKWPLWKTLAVFSVFLFIDFAFFGANLEKIPTGGWVPLLFSVFCLAVMVTWKKGMEYLRQTFYLEKIDISLILNDLSHPGLSHVPNTTAVFIADTYDKSGGGLLHYLKLNRIVPQNILVVSINIENHPYLSIKDHFELINIGEGVYRLILHYGFMQLVNIPQALSVANERRIFPFELNVDELTYLVEITHVTATRRKRTLMFYWQEKLFAFLMRNAALDIEFFHLPFNRTIAIGTYCEI